MRHGRLLLGVLLIFLVLLLNLLAASPSLHQLLHGDANHAEHQCAVTLFAHGKVDTASVAVPISVPLAVVETAPAIIFSSFSPAIEHLPAGRAPPAASSNS